MAKPNYQFAKRQRDLAQKQKKEAKLLRKSAAQQEAAAQAAEPPKPAEGDPTT